MRWEDFTQTAIDPSDDCTIWYVGDYIKKDETRYSSRIGAFRFPGCRDGRGPLSIAAFFDFIEVTMRKLVIVTAMLLAVSSAAQTPNQEEKPFIQDYIKAVVGSPPASLGVDPFYSKYADALGISILSSEKVPDAALLVARDIVIHMLAKRPDLRAEMVRKKMRVGVMAQSESTDIPEHRDRKRPSRDDARLTPGEKANYDKPGGIASMTTRSIGTVVLGAWAAIRRPARRKICSVIPAHVISARTFSCMSSRTPSWVSGIRTADSALFAEIQAAYKEAMAKGLWKNHYGSTNANEYWAEGTQTWFWSNYEFMDGETRVQTPEDLQR